MPLVDMPLEELRKYNGINPCPADFDKYWDESIAEMQKIDPKIELIPTTFKFKNVEAYDIYFTGVGNARIHGRYVKPLNVKEGKHPAVVCFHGYSGQGDNFGSLLSFASQGYSALSVDARGQAGLSEDIIPVRGTTLNGHIVRGLSDPDPKNLLFRAIFLDCAQLAKIAMGLPEVDENEVYAIGGSQGGALTTACIALEPKVKKALVQFPFLCDYKRTWELDLFKDAYGELSYYFRNFDPLHEREDEIFERLGYIDIQFLAKRIKAKVLFLTGLMDTICPPSTQFSVYNKITSEKDMFIYPDYGHEGLPNEREFALDFFAKD